MKGDGDHLDTEPMKVVSRIVPPFGEAAVILPAKLTAVPESFFEGDQTVTAVYIPDSCTKIDKNAFKDCSRLAQVRLPKDCEIDGTAFDGSSAMPVIYAPAGGTTETRAQALGITFAANSEE